MNKRKEPYLCSSCGQPTRLRVSGFDITLSCGCSFEEHKIRSISHWGLHDHVATPMAAPLTWLADICRLRSEMETLAGPIGHLIGGTHLRMAAEI